MKNLILAATSLALFWLWLDRPKPSRLVQTDYCVVDYKAAAKDEMGNLHIFWTKGYRPCRELDRFENA